MDQGLVGFKGLQFSINLDIQAKCERCKHKLRHGNGQSLTLLTTCSTISYRTAKEGPSQMSPSSEGTYLAYGKSAEESLVIYMREP